MAVLVPSMTAAFERWGTCRHMYNVLCKLKLDLRRDRHTEFHGHAFVMTPGATGTTWKSCPRILSFKARLSQARRSSMGGVPPVSAFVSP